METNRQSTFFFIKTEETNKHTTDGQRVCNKAQSQFFNRGTTKLHLNTVEIKDEPNVKRYILYFVKLQLFMTKKKMNMKKEHKIHSVSNDNKKNAHKK